MEKKYDFSGWATKANLKCSDGRTILRDAFKHCDGMVVPLVWGHQHNDPLRVLGHALLENREDGVYTYGTFNDTEQGQNAKLLVEHGDVTALSIYANQLKQQGGNVLHGSIREVSLVLAGANPGAFIDSVLSHSEDGEPIVSEDEGILYTGEEISLYHADDAKETKESKEDAKKDDKKSEETKESKDTKAEDKEETVQDVIDSMTEKQQTVMYALIGKALEDSGKNDVEDDADKEDKDKSEGGKETMKHNVFDTEEMTNANVLSHSDQEEIIAMAKTSGVGSLQDAIRIYGEKNGKLAHGIDDIETLFPEAHNINPGAPELVRADQSWVMKVINKIHKSPYSRIRTRQADARIAGLRAKGYQTKGDEKRVSANIKLLGRTTDPQTVYRKDMLNRDDIIDITDFDVVNYQWGIMKGNMYEELALAALVGDGREEGDPDKIHETHIHSIWNDAELYTIHADVDFEAARTELQGTNTSANFSENYIYAEAMIMAALYAREQYKGSGTPDYYCAPHSVNVMLLARDLNGRRIYESKADLARALNVGEIYEIEQLEGRTRTAGNKTKKLHGIFVNLADYTFGSTKGGELTKFEDFDIDFNQYKYLIETRLSGALTKIKSAIALEEDVTTEVEPEEDAGDEGTV